MPQKMGKLFIKNTRQLKKYMVILSSKKNTKIKYKNKKDSNQSNMPMWRNW